MKADCDNFVLLHEVTRQVFEPLNFGLHDDWINDPFRAVSAVPSLKPAGWLTLTNSLELGLSNELAQMSGRARLARSENDIGIGLTEYRLGFLAVQSVQLAHALESENNRIVGLALLRQRRMKLWECIEGCKLIKDHPHARFRWIVLACLQL
jgi:hypothetical protein